MTKPNKEVAVQLAGRSGYFPTRHFCLFLSRISAGFPSPADDYIDRALDLNELLVTNPPATFFVRVDGPSLIEDGVFPGDILSVDRSLQSVQGDKVVAVVNGELTVKELSLSPLRLLPRNKDFQPIDLHEHDDFEIIGVVKGLVRVFR